MYAELIQAGPAPGFKCVNEPTGEVHELVNLSGVWPADGRATVWRGDDQCWVLRKMVGGPEADLFECWARAGDGRQLVVAFRRDALAYALFDGLPVTRRLSWEDDPACVR